MFRIAIVILFLSALIAQTNAATGADWKLVAKVLDTIPSAAGMSVLKRIERCHYTVLKDSSFMETRAVAWPKYDAKAGQTVLQVTMQLSHFAGETPADAKPVSATWIIDHGKATPLSDWANALQNHPLPMGYDTRTNC